MTPRALKKWFSRLGVLAFWLVVWQLASQVMGSQILLAGPWDTLRALLHDIVTAVFWQATWFSFQRIVLGFILAFCLGMSLAVLAHRLSLVRVLIEPAVSFIKSVPVVCIIVLLLILVGSRQVSTIVVILVVFPAIYFSAHQGILSIDQGMEEMLKVFDVSPLRRAGMLYWPSMLPFLLATSNVVVGMSWKSGVAAEIIGIPLGSIGERLYMSKILLETAELFSWTFVIVLVSMVCERIFLVVLTRSRSWGRALAMPRLHVVADEQMSDGPASDGRAASGTRSSVKVGAQITLDAVSKSFGDRGVLRGFSYTFCSGERYCLTGPSGIGKTTLARIIVGLGIGDSGSVKVSSVVDDGTTVDTSDSLASARRIKIGMVFQEARLFEDENAIDNILLVAGRVIDAQGATDLLANLLPMSALKLPVSQLSGGMRRRVEICRALAAPSQALVFDEPFAGLDDTSKADVIALIDTHLEGRTLIVITHDEDDAIALDATVVTCEGCVGLGEAGVCPMDDTQR